MNDETAFHMDFMFFHEGTVCHWWVFRRRVTILSFLERFQGRIQQGDKKAVKVNKKGFTGNKYVFNE